MYRTCPVCASESVPFGQFMRSHRWRPVVCTNCGAALALDFEACLRAAVPMLALTAFILVLYAYFALHPARLSLVVLTVTIGLYVAIFVRLAFRILWQVPLRVRAR